MKRQKGKSKKRLREWHHRGNTPDRDAQEALRLLEAARIEHLRRQEKQ